MVPTYLKGMRASFFLPAGTLIGVKLLINPMSTWPLASCAFIEHQCKEFISEDDIGMRDVLVLQSLK
jgi:hypothetical protein